MRAVLLLARRAIRELWRIPAATAPSLFIPAFFLVVNSGALGKELEGAPFLYGQKYLAFQLPASVLLAVAVEASNSGLALVTDIDRGYFDKLLVTPIQRTSILFGRLASDFVRVALQASIVLLFGMLLGARIESGVGGFVVLVIFAAFWGVAYAGIGQTVALRTRNVQATQASFMFFFPLLFLAPTIVPRENMQGWMEVAATLNPVTYVLEGLRSLILQVWDGEALLWAAVSILGLGTVLTTLSLRALRRFGD